MIFWPLMPCFKGHCTSKSCVQFRHINFGVFSVKSVIIYSIEDYLKEIKVPMLRKFTSYKGRDTYITPFLEHALKPHLIVGKTLYSPKLSLAPPLVKDSPRLGKLSPKIS